MKLARVLLVLLVVSLNGTASTEASEATLLLDIEIETTAEETKVHLKADGAIKDYRAVKLKKNVGADRPDRMYLDVKNVRLAGPIPVKQVGTALSQVRNARRTNGLRVVFDSSLAGLFDYTISEQPDGLLVTIREPSADPAAIADIMPEDESGDEPEKVIAPVVATIQPEPKAEGDLGLLIVAADSPEQTQEWLGSLPDRKIGLQILETVKPDQEINTLFLVTGVAPDSNGNFSVEVSFTMLDPSGNPMFSNQRFAKTSGRAPANPAFLMTDPMLSLVLGESDPVGDYRIIGIVEDLTTKKMFRTSIKITLEK